MQFLSSSENASLHGHILDICVGHKGKSAKVKGLKEYRDCSRSLGDGNIFRVRSQCIFSAS
jgi:hypothetical protein